MQSTPPIAFATETEQPALEIRVNFGLFAGREATPAELDELAKELLPDVGEVSIVSEQRHEVSEDVEAAVHQVRIEISEEQLPPVGDGRRRALTERLVATAERWARACIADRHVDVGAF
jgi:hypothetical protein